MICAVHVVTDFCLSWVRLSWVSLICRASEPHEREWRWTLSLLHMQNLTKNGLKPQLCIYSYKTFRKIYEIHKIRFGNDFMEDVKSLGIKRKVDKFNYIKIKLLCIRRVKKRTREWRHIFANHLSDRDWHPKYIKVFLQLNNKRLRTVEGFSLKTHGAHSAWKMCSITIR